MLHINTITCTDVLLGLGELDDNSVDMGLTDPPYGYGFMGKDWDKAVPPVSTWKEFHRVLKPGAFCFVMSAPRQDVLSKMICNLSDAGFRTDFTSIYWTYASGFPKAGNIGKMVDKRLGVKREDLGESPNWRESKRDREKYGSMEVRGENAGRITKATSLQAQALDGSYAGYQPKPAVEVIIVCMKPLSEKTYVEQALKNRKGVTWLDDCRVSYESEGDIKRYQKTDGGTFLTSDPVNTEVGKNGGRFPANLICSDDTLNDGKVRKSGKMDGTYSKDADVYGKYNPTVCKGVGDSGSYSRYFDLDAWWTEQIKKLPESVQKTFPFLIVPKASRSEKNKGLEGCEEKETQNKFAVKEGRGRLTERPDTKHKNHHPTVKPLKLMSYLITLGSREGDTILDPYVGSGTTCMAAKMLNRKYIVIDNEPEYVEITKKRVGSIRPNLL